MDPKTVDGFTMDRVSATTMRVTWAGAATAAAVDAMNAYALACNASGPELVNLLVDASAGEELDSEARKRFKNSSEDAKLWQRVAFVGVRFEVRVLIELIVRALSMLGQDLPAVKFVATQDEALAWFGESVS